MKLAPPSRHLEVQLLCDVYGNVCSVHSRDCSVQRRHQKIVEEGPLTAAPKHVLKEMEKNARALAKAVRYVGAATVEYLYVTAEQKYYFLELNPRLQVEHPVTEWISGINIPSVQLMIGMGIPLYRIPDIRRLYGRKGDGAEVIDFDKDNQSIPDGHVVAVRVTSEDADDGFKPTCGGIDELQFRSTPEVWGYFSVKAGGVIHEFSDSQFGHVFAKGETRSAAIRAAVVALKEIKVRGEIRTNVDYAIDMIQNQEFVDNKINTGWLDARIAARIKSEKPAWHLAVVIGSVLGAMRKVNERAAEYLGYLQKGAIPPASVSLVSFTEEFVLDGTKYIASVQRKAPTMFSVCVGDSSVDVAARTLSDGGVLMQVDGQSHVVHVETEPMGTRISINSKTVLLTNDEDPSKLLAPSPGKLVRWLVQEGEKVEKDEPYAEVEVMKMMMPLLAPASGVLHQSICEGGTIVGGQCLAILDLDDPSAVQTAKLFEGSLPELGPPQVVFDRADYRFNQALDDAKMILAGYNHDIEEVFGRLQVSLFNKSVPLQLFNDQQTLIRNRLPESLVAIIDAALQQHIEHGNLFPAKQVRQIIEGMMESVEDSSYVDPMLNLLKKISGEEFGFACNVAIQLFEQFLNDEERFQAVDGSLTTDQDVIDALRQEYSSDLQQVLDTVLSHQAIVRKSNFILKIMESIVAPRPEHFRPQLRRFAALTTGPASGSLAPRAVSMLEHSLLGQLQKVVLRTLLGQQMFEGKQDSEFQLQDSTQSRTVMRKTTKSEGLYQGLHQSTSNVNMDARINMLVQAPAAVEHALATLLSSDDLLLQSGAVSAYIKRLYYPYLVDEPTLISQGVRVGATWSFESDRGVAQGALLVVQDISKVEQVRMELKSLSGKAIDANPNNQLHVVVVDSIQTSLLRKERRVSFDDAEWSDGDDIWAKRKSGSIQQYDPVKETIRAVGQEIRSAGFDNISIVLQGSVQGLPTRSGFRWNESSQILKHDPILKYMEAHVASQLEMQKLEGFKGRHIASRNRQFHVFTVKEQPDPKSYALNRVFIRTYIRNPSETVSEGVQKVIANCMKGIENGLVGCLEELERVAFDSTEKYTNTDWAHVFLTTVIPNYVGWGREEEVVALLKALVSKLVSQNSLGLRRAAVAQIEIKIQAADASQPAWRVVVATPSGHESGEEHIQVYLEQQSESQNGEKVKVYRSKSVGLVGQLDGTPVLAPYRQLEALQHKRLAAHRLSTTYCYDFPAVFEDALRKIWAVRQLKGYSEDELPSGKLVQAEELVLKKYKNGFKGDLQVQVTQRPIGENKNGMVAWLMTMLTPECPEGRKIVAIANDITRSAGSFGPMEDAMFKAATEYALDERLPIVYLAANSGAKFGLAQEVRDCLKVQWTNQRDPTKGFEYLYLDEEDHKHFCSLPGGAPYEVQEILINGNEKRYKLTDVVGIEDGLGVECLSGSGAIASSYSKAFNKGFTITLVSGRTVGIGAYLARLGRRCVQRIDQPMILTGYQALNKVLGRQVYSSHMQLGGPKVMGVNGVSHFVVEDDLKGVGEILRWLSFVPAHIGEQSPLLLSKDPVDRLLTYYPKVGEKLDPRKAIQDVFDVGSWVEAQAGWARTVVTGRARLGGMPVGVIAVETDTVQICIPADPGQPDSSSQNIAQAGQVWFPDSADKTAQAIEEFNLEGLPLLVMANWRGFSGGQRDLFQGVLQAGSLIVEQLRRYKQPVFVYLPPGAELRGGAWVVIDSQINPDMIEMYADSTARAGVLEPEGIIEIKFKSRDLIKAMHRLDEKMKQLKSRGDDEGMRKRENELLPIFSQVATKFADFHDTPMRMKRKGVIKEIVEWREARKFFTNRLSTRLRMEQIAKEILKVKKQMVKSNAIQLAEEWFHQGEEIVGEQLKKLRTEFNQETIEQLFQDNDGMQIENVLQFIKDNQDLKQRMLSMLNDEK